ncbi:hypothetical protein B1219_20455 [Pseudomonas ogarae]|nr:hypothetical protein B1219_20455 [Pseudomonas ogarae]
MALGLAPSRASFAPTVRPAYTSHLWERACSRRRRPIQNGCKLTHRFREQARSHRGFVLNTLFVNTTDLLWEQSLLAMGPVQALQNPMPVDKPRQRGYLRPLPQSPCATVPGLEISAQPRGRKTSAST